MSLAYERHASASLRDQITAALQRPLQHGLHGAHARKGGWSRSPVPPKMKMS